MGSAERTLGDALGVLLLRETRRDLYATLTHDIVGLDATTYPVLSGLARTGEVTISALAATVGLDRSVTSRHASALERAGLLERRVHGRDRRAITLALSEAGRHAIEVTRARLDQHLHDFLNRRAGSDADRFVRLLGELVEHLKQPPEPESAERS